MSNPVTPPPRPANIEQWGREGERFQAGAGQAQAVPAIGPAQPAQPSPFQHRNPAIQVPPFQMQQQQQQLGPRYIYRQSPICFVFFVWHLFGHGYLVTVLVTALTNPLGVGMKRQKRHSQIQIKLIPNKVEFQNLT